jgi:hypothetical protein
MRKTLIAMTAASALALSFSTALERAPRDSVAFRCIAG